VLHEAPSGRDGAASEEKALGETQQLSELRGGLTKLKLSQLQAKAREAYVEAGDIEGCLDSDTPKESLIELLMAAGSNAPGGTAQQAQRLSKLRDKLTGLKLSQLQARAREAGVEAGDIVGCLDSDDPRGAMVEAVVQVRRVRSHCRVALPPSHACHLHSHNR
jgi:hypothetical protein